jgi:hypothetical protein
MPNPNQRTPATRPAGSRPARTSEQAVPERVVLLGRCRAALGDLDQICQCSREPRFVLHPVPESQPVLTEPVSVWCLRHRVGVQLLRSQDPAGRVPRRQPRRTFEVCSQQPTQRTSDAVTHVQADSRHGRQILHTPTGTDILTRRRRAPGAHNQRRPHLGASKPPSHRRLRPTRNRPHGTAAHPRNRSTPSGDPSRSWVVPQRPRHPKQVIDLNRWRHHPRRHDTHPRHGIEYAHRPRQPAPNNAAKGRSLQRPGRRPEPRHHFGEQGKITRLVISSRRGQALPDGEPLHARDTPPLHSGPTARQPTGAPRGDNQPHHQRVRRTTSLTNPPASRTAIDSEIQRNGIAATHRTANRH